MIRVIDLSDDFFSILNKHVEYRNSSLNLVASENILSPGALKILSSDLNGRYASQLYGGTEYIRRLVDLTNQYLRELFNVEFAESKPVSGTISVVTVLHAFSEPGDKVGILNFKDGGFPLNITGFRRKPVYLPFDEQKLNIDIDSANEILSREKPKLVYLGASRFLFPHPVREISEVVHDYGGIVAYDGSHVLGLIAGGKFQDPLREGADILLGSTHKTFPGPQGGVILVNDRDIWEKIESILSRPYMFVDNPHVARLVALGYTAYEMIRFGRDYANQIVLNAKKLASELDKVGVGVKCRKLGYTESHQILLNPGKDPINVKEILERNRIFIDAIGRIGVQEVTRRGMGVNEMAKIAEFFKAILLDGDSVEAEVKEFTKRFTKPKYCYGC